MKRRLTALLCVAAVFLTLLCAPAAAVDEVCFTAVNESMLPLTADTMPVWVDGILYAPSTIFDSNSTGVNLGLQYTQGRTNNTVTLYTLRQMLVFDLTKGISYDQHTGRSMADRAINRNGRIYLPVLAVCRFFELNYYYTRTDSGYLLRVSSDAARLSDARFLDAASATLPGRLEEYIRSQTPAVPDPPAPPEIIDPPVPPNTGEDVPQVRVQVCLALRCETGEGLEQTLDQLDRQGVRALFLFAPELLAAQDALVRRVVGSGHPIGLLTEEEELGAARSALERGNEILSHVARTAATAVLAPAAQRGALEEEGWVCWQETMDARPRSTERAAAYAQRVINTVGTRRRTVYLTLEDSARAAGMLPTLLQQLEQQGCTVITPLETRL